MVNIITEPSPPHMCSAPTLTYSWAGWSNTKPVIKCWISHVICRVLYWKWKTEWVSGYRTVVCPLFTLVVLCWLGAAPQHHKGVSNRSSLAMKRSKFQIPSMVPAEGISLSHDFLSTYPFTLSVPRICQAQCCLRTSVFIPSSREAPAADSLTADSSLSLSHCSVLLGEASPNLRESGSFTSLWHSVTSPVACSFSHYHGLILSYTCLHPPEEYKFCESQDLSIRFTTVYFAPCT